MRNYFCILTAVLVLLSIGGIADAATYSKEQIAQDPELQELINNVPAADPDILEQVREDQNVRAVFGQIPKSAVGKETYSLYGRLDNVRANVRADGALKEYICPNGPVCGFGVNANNYFVVLLYDEAYECSDDTVNEIHAILNTYGKKEGFEDMPIVFRSGGPLKSGVRLIDIQTEKGLTEERKAAIDPYEETRFFRKALLSFFRWAGIVKTDK